MKELAKVHVNLLVGANTQIIDTTPGELLISSTVTTLPILGGIGKSETYKPVSWEMTDLRQKLEQIMATS